MTHLDPVQTLMFALVLMTVCAGVAELLDKRLQRRCRDEARAAARAKRMEGADRSDESSQFSWWEQPDA